MNELCNKITGAYIKHKKVPVWLEYKYNPEK